MLNNYTRIMEIALPAQREYAPFADDANIAAYAKDAAVRLYRAKIVEGYTDGSFQPENATTRAEYAAMIKRIMDP